MGVREESFLLLALCWLPPPAPHSFPTVETQTPKPHLLWMPAEMPLSRAVTRGAGELCPSSHPGHQLCTASPGGAAAKGHEWLYRGELFTGLLSSAASVSRCRGC